MPRSPTSHRAWSKQQLRRIPELRHFDRRDPFVQTYFTILGIQWWNAHAHAFVASLAGLTLWILIVPIVAILISMIAFLLSGSMSRSGMPWAWGLAAGLASSAFLWRRAFFAHQAEHTPFIRAELRRRGVPICIPCGYEGGDVTNPRCPECGKVSIQPTPEPAFRRRASLSHRDLKIAPELGHLPANDPALLQWAGIHGMASWAFFWCAIAGALAWSTLYVTTLIFFADALSYWSDQLPSGVLGWAALAMWIAPYLIAIALAWRRLRAVAIRRMRIAVRRMGIPVCAWCGYNAGDITAPRCPECGAVH